MNIARINCAHDGPDTWIKMVRNINKAARTTNLPCKIYLDLAGPKIRTSIDGKGRKKDRMKLRVGEVFYLAEADAQVDKKNKIVGCSLPGVVKDLQPGHRVLFDDGLFEAFRISRKEAADTT